MKALFTDAQGREWHPRFTFGILGKIKDELGADLLKPAGAAVLGDISKVLKMFHLAVAHEEPDFEAFCLAVDPGPGKDIIQAFTDALGIFMQGPDYKRPAPDEDSDAEEADPT